MSMFRELPVIVLVVGVIPLVWSAAVRVVHSGAARAGKAAVGGMRLELTALAVMVAPTVVGVVLQLGAAAAPEASAPLIGLLDVDWTPVIDWGPAAPAAVGAPSAAEPGGHLHLGEALWAASAAFALIYALGFAVAAFWLARARLRLDRIAAASAPSPALGGDVRLTDGAVAPFAGPRGAIVLPRALLGRLPADDVALIVSHERAHLERGDPRTYWALAWIDAAFWFNPFIRRQTARCRLAAELACDERVVRGAPERRQAYAQTLLVALKHAATTGPRWAPSIRSGQIRGEHHMRLTHILSDTAFRPRPRRWAALVAAGLLGAPLAAVQLACAQTPDAEAAAGPVATADAAAERVRRELSPAVRDAVDAAQAKLAATPADNAGALDDLDRALAASPTPYELGVVLALRGRASYANDDADGAFADWNRALAEAALEIDERRDLLFFTGQLLLARQDYADAVTRLEAWIAQGGEPSDGTHLNLVAAYVELGDMDAARTHAEEALAVANPPKMRHYDTLIYLSSQLEDYEAAIGYAEQALALANTPEAEKRLNQVLVADYNRLGDLSGALEPAQRVFALASPPGRNDYRVLLYIYSQLGMTEQLNALLATTPPEYIPDWAEQTP